MGFFLVHGAEATAVGGPTIDERAVARRVLGTTALVLLFAVLVSLAPLLVPSDPELSISAHEVPASSDAAPMDHVHADEEAPHADAPDAAPGAAPAASAGHAHTRWSGRVMDSQNRPVSGAWVRAECFCPGGQQCEAGPEMTKPDGSFELELPGELGGLKVSRVVFSATGTPRDGKRELRGELTRTLSGVVVKFTRMKSWPVLFIPIVVVYSLLLALSDAPSRWKFWVLVLLGSVAAIWALGVLTVAITAVSKTATMGQVHSVGFASLYYGTFTPEGPSSWLVSLTDPPLDAPAAAGTGAGLTSGLGAPLWALFLAQIGSVLYMLVFIASFIPADRLNTEKKRVEGARGILVHQFYVVFSPLGAVFVYQLLVAGGAADGPATAALILLAAGLSLTYLLERAREGLVGAAARRRTDSRDDPDGPDDAAPADHPANP